MKLAMIGTGYVGLVTGTIFAEKGHQVVCIDIDQRKVDTLNKGGIPIYEPGLKEMVEANRKAGRLTFTHELDKGIRESEVIFICVGTPMDDDGTADLSYVENVARQIAKNLNGYKLVVEKSTVPVKTGEKVKKTIEMTAPKGAEFDVASNPEFLKEGTAIEDALKPDRVVVGVGSDKARAIFSELYKPFDCPIVFTDINSAEIIKHASNSFLATKISFVNAVANICELAGASIDDVVKGMGLDRRISPHFLSAGVGYGGSCFPKDVQAFERIAHELGYNFHLLNEVQEINKRQRNLFVKRIKNALWIVKGKKIAVLGLAFKPETDDMREAPSIDIVRALVDEGAQVSAHDPEAMANARHYFGDKITYADSPEKALDGAHALVILTEWKQYRTLDLDDVKRRLAHPIVLDGRNLFSPTEMRRRGFDYRSIGRV
ncbi:MAG: UDP-glucose/GDP-mannose dehydrogenase family protein [Planctomycetota bacterium]